MFPPSNNWFRKKGNIYNTAFKKARKRASKMYPSPEEDRKDLMGHKSGRSMTEHYSVPELTRMHDYVSKITHPPAKRMTLVKNG